jgi:hypothetical protein
MRVVERAREHARTVDQFRSVAAAFEANPSVEWVHGRCTIGTTGIIGPITVLPPAVPIQNDAILTYADVRYLGIKVTAYDKVGATATTTFPDLRIVFTSSEERTAAP